MEKRSIKSIASDNRNSSGSLAHAVPIRAEESEQGLQGFGDRLKGVIGNESYASFARRCDGISDSLIGAYVRGEKKPTLNNLLAIAMSAGVLMDWLATGRPPKTRAEVRPKTESAMDTWKEAVQAVQDWQIRRKQMLPTDKFMQTVELIADLAGEGGKDAVRPLAERVLRLVV